MSTKKQDAPTALNPFSGDVPNPQAPAAPAQPGAVPVPGTPAMPVAAPVGGSVPAPVVPTVPVAAPVPGQPPFTGQMPAASPVLPAAPGVGGGAVPAGQVPVLTVSLPAQAGSATVDAAALFPPTSTFLPDGSPAPVAAPAGDAMPGVVQMASSPSPGRPPAPVSVGQRAWRRFRSHRRGWWSLWIFIVLFVVSLFAELISNDRPLVASYQGKWFVPLVTNPPETSVGGDFRAPIDYHDPFIIEQFDKRGNWAVWPLNRYSYNTLNYYAELPNPAPPSRQNYLGTDDRGRDVLARLLYGFRLSVLFGLALTAIGMVLGIIMGAIQGYFAGKIDLTLQRLIEVWSSVPELYLLLILASMFEPSIWVLLVILSLFGWMGLSDYVRAEFLRNRQMEYVQAARALGLPAGTIIWRHILPNSLTSVVAFLPFRMSAAIVALTSLDFLGLGVSADSPSLGELLAQGKTNLDAWWISLPTFTVLVGTLLLLIFIGEALRDALDPRKR